MAENELEEIRLSYMQAAANLPDFKKLSVDDLANGYCAAKDSHNMYKQDMYFAALMLRFWSHVSQIVYKCRAVGGFTAGDAASLVASCITTACDYRAWQDETKKTNAQACINQVIGCRGAPAVIYNYNRDRHKVNVNLIGLEAPVTGEGAAGDKELLLMDTIQSDDTTVDEIQANSVARSFVQSYINKDRIVEAIILDTVAFSAAEMIVPTTKSKKVTDDDGEVLHQSETTYRFWPGKCAEALEALPEDYAKHFSQKYSADAEVCEVAFNKLRSLSHARLAQQVSMTLSHCRRDLHGEKTLVTL